MGKQIIYDEEALLGLQEGVALLAKAVKSTYGPKGRNVVIENVPGSPIISKDGITVAQVIELEDPFQNAGAALIKEVAAKTAAEAGDGTTTAIIIAEKMLTDGVKVVVAGINPVRLKKGIETALNVAFKELAHLAKPINSNKELLHIASIAANQDSTLGKLIADAFEKNGLLSIIEVEEAKGVTSALHFTEGGEINGSLLSPWFVTDTIRSEAVLENAAVLITDQKISAASDLLPLLQQIVDEKKPLLIIAKEIQEEVLSMLVTNCRNHVIQCVAAKPTAAGDRLAAEFADLSILTGTELITDEKGHRLKTISIGQLGQVKKVVVGSGKIRFITSDHAKNTSLKKTVSNLQKQFVAAKDSDEKRNISERLTRLSGGVIVLSVGATTETELKEKLYRTDDAVKAVRAALEEGTVPGGGITLLELAKRTSMLVSDDRDEQVGINLFTAALSAPFITMALNAALEPLPMISRLSVVAEGKGYNLNNGELVDMRKAGIIDSVKVLRVALTNAVSIAGELLKIKAVIVEESIENQFNNNMVATRN